MDHLADQRVVPTDDREIVRDGEAHLLRDPETGHGEEVAVEEDRARRCRRREELARRAGAALGAVVRLDRLALESELADRVEERGPPSAVCARSRRRPRHGRYGYVPERPDTWSASVTTATSSCQIAGKTSSIEGTADDDGGEPDAYELVDARILQPQVDDEHAVIYVLLHGR